MPPINRQRQNLTLAAFLWAVTIGVAVVALLSHLGQWGWLFDLCAHFRIHIIFALLTLGLVAPVYQHWRLQTVIITTLVLTLLTTINTPGQYTPPPINNTTSPTTTTTRAIPNKPLRVLHYNVLVGNPRRGEIAQYINQSNCDLVFLMEVNEKFVNLLRANCDNYIIAVAQPRDHPFGFAVLIRLQSSEHWTLQSAAVIEDLGANPNPNLDLHPNLPAAPPAIEIVMQHAGQTITVLGLHPPPPVSNRWWKVNFAQLHAAAKWANRQTTPVLIIGDLNATPWSAGFKDLVSAANLIDARDAPAAPTPPGLAATWPAQWPAIMGIPIDHSLHTPDLTTLSRDIRPALGSDHRPVEITLQTNP